MSAESPDRSLETPLSTASTCPLCGQVGREIPRKVLYQHLDARGILDIFQWKASWVCLRSDCACLYYSGKNWIAHQRCNKTVGFKNPAPPRVFCYCFGYTSEEILKKAASGEERTVLDQVGDYLQKGALLCPSTNPTGQCCFEMVQELLKKGHL